MFVLLVTYNFSDPLQIFLLGMILSTSINIHELGVYSYCLKLILTDSYCLF